MAKRNRKSVEPKIGENGSPLTADRKKQLAGYIGELEIHQREIDAAKGDQKLIFDSAKDAGFDTKAIRTVLKDRKTGRDKIEKHQAVVDVYKHALGMLSDLPLGVAAMQRAGLTVVPPSPQVDLEEAIAAKPAPPDDEVRTADPN